MCRIAGIIDFNKSFIYELKSIVISMRDSMVHGGPDDAGFYLNNDLGIALGHRRLSIIDTSNAGHQPMSNIDETIWITYNGEIYNFQELRDELIKIGYHFKSRTDTEVLIYGYEEWGIEKLLSRIRGMFAFAILDLRKPSYKLFLAKDRFGIKPLYYYKDKQKFVFSSEVRAILRSGLVPDEKSLEAMVRFLQLGSVPVPLTTVKNVFALPSGHYMEVTPEKFNIKQYYNLAEVFNSKKDEKISFEEAASQTRKLLEESVKLHLVSDVPVGVFLSGGIDSSGIVAFASKYMNGNKLSTISLSFNEKEYDESEYAKLIAKKYQTDHHEILVTGNDFYNELPNIFNAMDEPTVDGVNVYFASKVAKNLGLKVILSGIGADEVFLGYDFFKFARFLNSPLKLFASLPRALRVSSLDIVLKISKLFRKREFKKLCYLEDPSQINSYLLFRGLFTSKQIQDLLGISEKKYTEINSFYQNEENINGLVNYFDYQEFEHYLQNQILKDNDFIGMKNSIEIRVPFLDHTLVESVISLSLDYKLDYGINKPLLKSAIKNYLPSEVLSRQKMCFTFPFEEWIKSNQTVFQDLCIEQKHLENTAVRNIWKGYLEGKVHWSRVWALIVLAQFKITESTTNLCQKHLLQV